VIVPTTRFDVAGGYVQVGGLAAAIEQMREGSP
jgi:hypothetical protein